MIVPAVRSRAFIGRDAELHLLRETRRSLSSGRGCVVLVGGDAGIGKSRLLAAFTETLSGGRAPLFALGECLEYASSAFGPVRHILDSLARRAPWAVASAPPLVRRTLRTLVPDALGAAGVAADAPALDRGELFSGVLAFLTTVAAKRSVVLAIEDLHWADPASLELLGHLAARIGGTRAMIVATYRNDALSPNDPLFAALARLTRIPHVTTLGLEPLASGAMATLVRSALDKDVAMTSEGVNEIVARSDGNPLFAEELLKRALTTGRSAPALPISIRAIILERLASLDAEARLVLERAALVGPAFEASSLSLASDRSVEALRAILARLQALDLIVADGSATRFRFRHALTRDAVYGEIPPADARRLHAEIARALGALPDANDRLDELAYHSSEGGLEPEACEYNERAGERAMALHAAGQAAAYFRRALERAPHDDVERRLRLLERAGAAASRHTDFPNAIAAFTALHDLRLARAEFDAAGTALQRAANDIANTNRAAEAIALLEAFVATYGARLSASVADILNSSLAYLATTQEAHDRVPELLERVREPGRLATHPHEMYWLARLFAAERHVDRSAWHAAVRAIRARLHEAHPLAHGQLLHSIGQTALPLAENDEAERSLDEAIAYDREHGLTNVLAFASALKVRLLFVLGRLNEAVPLVRFVLDNRDMVAVRSQLMMGAPFVALALGDEQLARRCLDEEILADTSDGPEVLINAQFSAAMAAWLERIGRAGEARRVVNAALEKLDRPFADAVFWSVAASHADEPNMRRVRDLCALGARNPDDTVMHATLPLVTAILAERAGDRATARDDGARAAERFRCLGWPLFEAKALELAGRADGALALYRSCESIADMRRLEVRVRDTARAGAGAGSRRRIGGAFHARASGRGARRSRLHQPRDRRGAAHQREHRREARHANLRETRFFDASGARGLRVPRGRCVRDRKRERPASGDASRSTVRKSGPYRP